MTEILSALSQQLRNQSREQGSANLVPFLRAAVGVVHTHIPPRLVGELYGLLLSDVSLSRPILVLVTMLLRTLSGGEVPKFILENFQGSLASYAPDRIGYILDSVLALRCPEFLMLKNLDFLATLVRGASVPVRLKALSCFVHKHVVLATLDTVFVSNLICPSKNFMMETDASACVEKFTPLVHSASFAPTELMHIGLVSQLKAYVKLRFAKPEMMESVSPPNTPVAANVPASPLAALNCPSGSLGQAVASLVIRLLEQSWQEVNVSIFGKKNFKSVQISLTRFTNEFVEQCVCELVEVADVLCSSDPTLVSSLFPVIRKTFDRVAMRPNSPGIAITAILSFFLNHGYLLMFDPEPALRFFFSVHLPKLVSPNGSPLLGVVSGLFLTRSAALMPNTLLREFCPAILQLAAWYPRTVDLRAAVSQNDHFFFQKICHLPLLAAVLELSLDINHYVRDYGEDLFVESRAFLRIVRSTEFRSFHASITAKTFSAVDDDFPAIWPGLALTPRVAAASKLVFGYLSNLLTQVNQPPILTKCCLERFGRMFQFRPEIATLFIQYLDKQVVDPADLVAAVCDRVHLVDMQSQILVAHLVARMAAGGALFVHTLSMLLDGGSLCVLPAGLQVASLQNGRIVGKPRIVNSKPTRSAPPSLLCLVVSSLAKIAANQPQYRPQIVHLLQQATAETVVRERIQESLTLLSAVHLCGALLSNSYH